MKRFAILAMICLTANLLTANPVLPAEAARVAGHFWQKQLNGKGDLQLASWPYGEIYLFIGESGGFVMVSADDCARPILAYSLEGKINPYTMPVQLVNQINAYQGRISEGVRQHVPATTQDASIWQCLRDGNDIKVGKGDRVGPLLETQWHQSGGYALLTPNHTPTGCAATAQAQMMRYWNYPAFGRGSETYNCPPYGAQSADFAHTLYDWENMPPMVGINSPQDQQMAVSTLMYHIGVSLHMAYADGGSGAAGLVGYPGVPSIDNSLKDYFYFSNKMRPIFRTDGYSDQRWADSLIAELDLLHPIIYCGVSVEGGHGFVCDGYEYRGDNVYFHFNFGWSGDGDAYYTIDDICPNVSPTGEVGAAYHFNQSNQALLGAVPDYRMHVSDTLITFTRDGGNCQLLFCSIDTSESAWNVSVDQPWVSVETNGVEHVGAIALVAAANSTGRERQATLTFTQAGEHISVRIVQTYYSEEVYCPLTVVMENTQNGGWEGNAHLSFESTSGYVYNTATLASGGYDSIFIGVPPEDLNIVFHHGGGTDRFINYRVYNPYGDKIVDVEYAFMNGGVAFVKNPCEISGSDSLVTDATVLRMELYDFSGRLLHVLGSGQSRSELPRGFYILKIFTDKGNIVKKLFKN